MQDNKMARIIKAKKEGLNQYNKKDSEGTSQIIEMSTTEDLVKSGACPCLSDLFLVEDRENMKCPILFLHNIYLTILALEIEALLNIALITSRIRIYLAVGSSIV